MQTIVEIPKTEEQIRRVWGMDFKPTKPTEQETVQAIIDLLKDMPIQTLQIAYLYAKNYSEYGEDVTRTWVTAIQNASALEKAYRKGYYDALQKQAESEE